MSLENWLESLKNKSDSEIIDILDGNNEESLYELYTQLDEFEGTYIDYECISIEWLQQLIIMAINNDYSGLDF